MKTAHAICLEHPASRCIVVVFLQCHSHNVLIHYHQFCVRCLVGKYMFTYLLYLRTILVSGREYVVYVVNEGNVV